MKKWSHWLVLVCNDKTCRSAMISMIVFSLLLVQSIAGQQHFPYYHQQFPPVLQPTPPIPRMYVSRVQLVCEVASPIGKLRWIRRGSAMEISAAILVAEGTASADPLKYAVTSTSDQNGLIRSVLTLLTPEPNLQQVRFIQLVRNAASNESKLTSVNLVPSNYFSYVYFLN